MKIIARTGAKEIATVYIAECEGGELIEFTESVAPPLPLSKKWILTVSTLYGCPVGCTFCDAGFYYRGKLSRRDISAQIDFLIESRFPDGSVPVEKFKIQFARMGEPAFNLSVLDVLEELPGRYNAPGLVPSISTVAPKGCDGFFERLLSVSKMFNEKRFQLQFSIHTTDERARDRFIPVKKWNFKKIGDYGETFYRKRGRKVTLNFALAKGMPIIPGVLLKHFDPDKFLVKMTPVNPTFQASKNNISSRISPGKKEYDIINRLRESGYEVILSIGDTAENLIGSNCGQHIMNYLKEKHPVRGGYTYPLHRL